MACSSSARRETPQQSNLTAGTVKARIEKGVTTQAEIMQLFGAPNLVTKNRANDEVWNYNRMAFQSVSGGEDWSLFLIGGSRAVSSSTSRNFDLIITFDSNDVVKDYSVIQAQF